MEVFFPVETHCDQCKGEERLILQAGLESRASCQNEKATFFSNALLKTDEGEKKTVCLKVKPDIEYVNPFSDTSWCFVWKTCICEK